MQLSWLVRRRMVVLIPARGSARRNLPDGAALRKPPLSLLVGLPTSALHHQLHSAGFGYLHVCGAHNIYAQGSYQAQASCGSPMRANGLQWAKIHASCAKHKVLPLATIV